MADRKLSPIDFLVHEESTRAHTLISSAHIIPSLCFIHQVFSALHFLPSAENLIEGYSGEERLHLSVLSRVIPCYYDLLHDMKHLGLVQS